MSRLQAAVIGCLVSTLATGGAAWGQVSRDSASGVDGTSWVGSLQEAGPGEFGFAAGNGKTIPILKLDIVSFNGAGDPAASAAPFHVMLGRGERLSGRLRGVTADSVEIETEAGAAPLKIARAGVLALVQRPGEVQVLREDFEQLTPARWVETGEPDVTGDPRRAGSKGLRLPAGGAAVTHRLAEPLGSGRFEVVYFDSGQRVPGQRWFVDLTFRGPAGLEPVQAVLGWEEETLAVLSRGGPALAVQPLTRAVGWHRLAVRFGGGRTDLTVDGNELAHGDAPGGPLVEIRLATEGGSPPPGLEARLDDLRLARFTEPSGRMEVDPSQDEARLIAGDQLFGQLVSADADRIAFRLDDGPAPLAWSEVSGVYFRRAPVAAATLDGVWVRLEWRVPGGGELAESDRVEGVLRAVGGSTLTVDVPYVGPVGVSTLRAMRMDVLGRFSRTVLDPTAHHLGNRPSDELAPPQPEGGTLDVPFTLAAVPSGAATLALDVLQVIGESGNLDFSDRVKAGELRTHVPLNGRPFDDLNRHVTTRNDKPVRIRLPIPAGALRVGPNVLRFEQSGTKDDPKTLDNLGLLGIAIESPPADAPGPRP